MNKNNYLYVLLFACCLGLLLRLFLAKYLTFELDSNTFKFWSYYLADHPLNMFYHNVWSDYLPGYHYVLWILGEIRIFLIHHSISFNETVLYKTPSILADILSSIFVFYIVKKFTTEKKALIASLLYLMNPAFMANSTFWGQADSFLTLFILGSFYFLIENKLLFSSVLIAFATTIKPIGILAIPLYLLYLQRKALLSNLIEPMRYLFTFTLTFLLIFLPFNNTDNLFYFIQSRFSQTFNQYTFTSLNAFNFWAITPGFWIDDKLTFLNIPYQLWGDILLGMIYLLAILIIIRQIAYKKANILLFSLALAIIYTAMFVFLTRIHERHFFPGLALIILNFTELPFIGKIFAVLASLIYVLNLLYPYFLLYQHQTIFSQSQITVLSVLNMLILFYLIVIFIRKYGKISTT